MCSNLKIIGIVGALGSGKTTIAETLEEDGFMRLAMAKPLKDMMRALGLTKMDVSGPQAYRAQPNDLLCGKSPRYAIQSIGTEWGRKLIGPDLWANAVQAQIIEHQTQCALGNDAAGCKGIVIEDIRFPNEVAMVQRLGGTIWRVRRPESEVLPTWIDRVIWRSHVGCMVGKGLARLLGHKPLHESEGYWPVAPADAEFWNTASQDDLKQSVRGFVQRMTTPNT